MFKFCVVTDRKLLDGKDIKKVLSVAISGGVDAVQIREKDLYSKELLELANDLRKITKDKALLFINDRIDIAVLAKADGVHLGTNSIPIAEAKKIFKGIIGVSCHSVKDVIKAEKNNADYVFLGPIFFTESKARYGRSIGLKVLSEVRKKTKIKVIAIGGINETNAMKCIDAGADGVAVISAIFRTSYPKESATRISKNIK